MKERLEQNSIPKIPAVAQKELTRLQKIMENISLRLAIHKKVVEMTKEFARPGEESTTLCVPAHLDVIAGGILPRSAYSRAAENEGMKLSDIENAASQIGLKVQIVSNLKQGLTRVQKRRMIKDIVTNLRDENILGVMLLIPKVSPKRGEVIGHVSDLVPGIAGGIEWVDLNRENVAEVVSRKRIQQLITTSLNRGSLLVFEEFNNK